jgi:hypothetical protein
MATQQSRRASFPAARETGRESKAAALAPEQARHNDESLTQKIRERAYFLAEAAGFPDGRADEFWHQAEREVR